MPLVKRAVDVDLGVTTDRLSLKCEEGAKYKPDVKLPYPVDSDQGEAKFDKSQQVLTLILPVKASDLDKSPVRSCSPAATDGTAY